MSTAMRYFTIEQRESLQRALEARAAQLKSEIREDLGANLDAEPEAAALRRDVAELRAVETALGQLHEPGFGLCADCGEEIPFSRLQAAPAATRCRPCEEHHERRAA